ncbi:hypothetical protein D3C87_1956850 [compost metagenome]
MCIELLEASAGDGDTIFAGNHDGWQAGNAVVSFVIFLFGVVNPAEFGIELIGEILEIGVVAIGADNLGHWLTQFECLVCEDRHLLCSTFI